MPERFFWFLTTLRLIMIAGALLAIIGVIGVVVELYFLPAVQYTETGGMMGANNLLLIYPNNRAVVRCTDGQEHKFRIIPELQELVREAPSQIDYSENGAADALVYEVRYHRVLVALTSDPNNPLVTKLGNVVKYQCNYND